MEKEKEEETETEDRLTATTSNDDDGDVNDGDVDDGDDVVATVSDNEDNDDNDNDDDDGPEAEGDVPPPPKPEPSYDKANNLNFYGLCMALEHTGKSKGNLKKLQCLLPQASIEAWYFDDESGNPRQPPESIFPLFRLLIPEKDSSRTYNLKESKLAKMYTKAFQLGRNEALKLDKFSDPKIVGTTDVGDFSCVLKRVLKPRIASRKLLQPSGGFSVGDINELLDELAQLPQTRKSNHDWKNKSNNNNKKKKGRTLLDMQADWLKKFNRQRRKWLSPLEHKWLVRIILHKSLGFGMGWKPILNWYHPMGSKLWAAHNSLKGILNRLCDSEYERLRERSNGEGTVGRRLSTYMVGTPVEIQFGIPFHPMLSDKTGFDRVLDDMSSRHRKYAEERIDAKKFPVLKRALALQHPAFTVETKLDGERMMLHVSREGVVKIHSRRSNWYSDLYTPVLGPAVRKAVGKHKMDMILDGEILAWDSGRNETVPFGNNRTIALLRQKYLRKMGLIEDRDLYLHLGEDQFKVMSVSNSFTKESPPYEIAGKECWLLFVAFDIVYLNGPGAADLLNETVSDCIASCNKQPGSLINLDGFERKKILHRVIDIQKQEVEIVQTYVVRPNGRSVLGSEYFSATNPTKEKCDQPGKEECAYTTDSIECNHSGTIQNIERIDILRRDMQSDEQISQARCWDIQEIYKQTVEDQRMEGLIFKDLSAPYVLGDVSRNSHYWMKFKPDYFSGSAASDIDVVIIGSFFATGLRDAGKPSSYLCACVDHKDPSAFLPLCKVNAGSVDSDVRDRFLKHTGFIINDANNHVEQGRWFREDGTSVPDFISSRSFQSGGDEDNDGWRVSKDTYPDLWIHPDHSAVLTLNAGEIVYSESFSVGLTLRFPRIHRFREDGDSKDPGEIESDRSMWNKYNEVVKSRQGNDAIGTVNIGSPKLKASSSSISCRFLTEKQNDEKKRMRRKTKKAPSKVRSAVDDVSQTSTVLEGMIFSVYEGRYSLRDDEIEVAAARAEGWYDDAVLVRDSKAVARFIKSHGGIVKVTSDNECITLGGRKDDNMVKLHIDGIEGATRKLGTTRGNTQAAKRNAAMSMNDGIVRWTYVYSLVYNLLKNENTEKLSEESIMKPSANAQQELSDGSPDITEKKKPSILDYLRRPSKGQECEGIADTLCREEISDPIKLWRAIDLLHQEEEDEDEDEDDDDDDEEDDNNNSAEDSFKPWQQSAMELDAEDRWIVSSQRQALWPYKECGRTEGTEVVLYADIHYDDPPGAGSTIRSSVAEKEILESCLPLARVMGAIVTSQFDEKVTHVLAALADGRDHVDYSDGITAQSFSNPVRGQVILDKLKTLGSGHDVALVSPAWIRKRKWQGVADYE